LKGDKMKSVSYNGEVYTVKGLLADETRTIEDFARLDNGLRTDLGLSQVAGFKSRKAGAESILKHLAKLADLKDASEGATEASEETVEANEDTMEGSTANEPFEGPMPRGGIQPKKERKARTPKEPKEKGESKRRDGRAWYKSNAERTVMLINGPLRGKKEGWRWEYRQKFIAYMQTRRTIAQIRRDLGPDFPVQVIGHVKYELRHGRLVFID
jgi:hypothetical protein